MQSVDPHRSSPATDVTAPRPRVDPPEFVTICAWTGRVQWRGSWVSVERYLRERFGVEVTHGISADGVRLFEGDSHMPGHGRR